MSILALTPVGYGRKNKLKEGKDHHLWYKHNTIGKSKYEKLSEKEKLSCDKIVIGELKNVDKIEFTAEWAKLVDKHFVE